MLAPLSAVGLEHGCAEAQGSSTAGIVVDFGTLGDAPRSTPSVACVPASGSSTGVELLRSAGHTLRFHSSGLLCAIDGYPAQGCGEVSDGMYEFWSYWQAGPGETSWTYSSIGPGGRRVAPGSVEGWRFLRGAARGGDAPPRAAPDLADICGAPEPEPPEPEEPDSPATPPAPPTGPAAPGSAPSSTGGADASPPSSGPTTTVGSVGGPDPAGSGVDDDPPPDQAGDPEGGAGANPGEGSAAGTAIQGSTSRDEVASGSEVSAAGGSGSPAWAGAAVGATLVGGLAGAGIYRSKRRKSTGAGAL